MKNSIISFYLFVCFLLNFIIFRSRTTSILYHSITSIEDQVIIFGPASIWYQNLTSIRDQVISICFKFLICDQSFLFVRFGTVLCVTKLTNPTIFDPFHYSLYPTTLLGLLSDRSISPAPKLNTTATSIDVVASTRIEIVSSPKIKTAAPEVATTSFDLCGYYFVVIRDSHHSFLFPQSPNSGATTSINDTAATVPRFDLLRQSLNQLIWNKHQVWHKKRA